jgi:GNAT superfamily N-acetyltransferase
VTVSGNKVPHAGANLRESRRADADVEEQLMLRPAVLADLPWLVAIRVRADAGALSDPALATDDLLRRTIAAGAAMVWDGAGNIAGFAAVDEGAIHLLVDPAQRDRGVGRALLAWACDAAKAAGHARAILVLPPGGTAERHYRAAGWSDAGRSPSDGLILKKPL